MPSQPSGFDIDPFAVLEAAAESILITTSDLDAPGPYIVYANPAFERMTGWSRAELRGRSPRILQGARTDLRIFADLKKTLRSGGVWEGHTINYRKDGSPFHMEWSIVPLKDERGYVHQYVAIQRDVSARVEAEQHLREVQDRERAADQARANLSRYFSPKLIETLATKDQPLGPVRRRNLAVLFADIVGFTRLSEMHEPEKVIELLRDIHRWMEQTIFRWDGSIEGYKGDAVLAIFGFPEPGAQDATNALSCAYELLAAAQHWNRERAVEGRPPIRIGIGVQYGPAVLGDVGAEQYFQFTVIGDTVNTASRLQDATRDLQSHLVVGQELIDAIHNETESPHADRLVERLERHGDLAIRGRSRAVEVWSLKADTNIPVSPRPTAVDEEPS